MLKLIFWILLALIIYTYLGYPLLLFLLSCIRKLFIHAGKRLPSEEYTPEVTLLIAAFNEREIVSAKMENTLALDYPSDKLTITWITDGSSDGTPELLRQYPNVTVLHQSVREGKTAALNRAMQYVRTPFVVFCDANTLLDKNAIKELMTCFSDDMVGCVAGEKRIISGVTENAAETGEGAYWKYESHVKRLESGLYSALAAAGELFAIRTGLFTEAEADSIIDDFVITIKIAMAGYRIKYAPDAYALEYSSMNIQEELKRKIRIASGGFQTLLRYPSLLNLFRYGFLSFEFISHKLLRWIFVPLSIPILFIFNLIISSNDIRHVDVYLLILGLQVIFYAFVFIGWMVEKFSIRIRMLFLPYYILIMNYAQIAGIYRYLAKRQTVIWEKAKRAQ
jgi:cellulose synthase/poly-beta-1,6-N-acetylglucosamine synthase-like glycosyltransferase